MIYGFGFPIYCQTCDQVLPAFGVNVSFAQEFRANKAAVELERQAAERKDKAREAYIQWINGKLARREKIPQKNIDVFNDLMIEMGYSQRLKSTPGGDILE